MKKSFIHCLVLVCVFLASFPEGAHGMWGSEKDSAARKTLLSRLPNDTVKVDLTDLSKAAVHLIREPNPFNAFTVASDKRSACSRSWKELLERHPRVTCGLLWGVGALAVITVVALIGYWVILPLVGGTAVFTGSTDQWNKTSSSTTLPTSPLAFPHGPFFQNFTTRSTQRPITSTPQISPFLFPVGPGQCPYQAEYTHRGGFCAQPGQIVPTHQGDFRVCATDNYLNECKLTCPPQTTRTPLFMRFRSCDRPGWINAHGFACGPKACGGDGQFYFCKEDPTTTSAIQRTTRRYQSSTQTPFPGPQPVTLSASERLQILQARFVRVDSFGCPEGTRPNPKQNLRSPCTPGIDQPNLGDSERIDICFLVPAHYKGEWHECIETVISDFQCQQGTKKIIYPYFRPCDNPTDLPIREDVSAFTYCIGGPGRKEGLVIGCEKGCVAPVVPDSSGLGTPFDPGKDWIINVQSQSLCEAHSAKGQSCWDAWHPVNGQLKKFKVLVAPQAESCGYDPQPVPCLSFVPKGSVCWQRRGHGVPGPVEIWRSDVRLRTFPQCSLVPHTSTTLHTIFPCREVPQYIHESMLQGVEEVNQVAYAVQGKDVPHPVIAWYHYGNLTDAAATRGTLAAATQSRVDSTWMTTEMLIWLSDQPGVDKDVDIHEVLHGYGLVYDGTLRVHMETRQNGTYYCSPEMKEWMKKEFGNAECLKLHGSHLPPGQKYSPMWAIKEEYDGIAEPVRIIARNRGIVVKPLTDKVPYPVAYESSVFVHKSDPGLGKPMDD